MTPCTQCTRPMAAATVKIRKAIGSRSFELTVQGERCENGHERVALPLLVEWEQAIARELVDTGPVEPEGVVFLRKMAGLQGSALAELLGVRRETVSRWENDAERPPDRATWATIGALALDRLEGRTATRDRLQGLERTPRKKQAFFGQKDGDRWTIRRDPPPRAPPAASMRVTSRKRAARPLRRRSSG